MTKIRKRSEEIRHFILENIEEHPADIAALTAEKFGISRQAVMKHIQGLAKQKALTVEGSTKNRRYRLHPLTHCSKTYFLADGLEEDVVWDSDIKPLLNELPDNVKAIWLYGFTEMFNNALEHSSGETVTVQVYRTAVSTEISITDDGEGIFKKIQRALNLADERHSVLELSKGKFTTDPEHHSGQGIFFSSRMFDDFWILSGNVSFSHRRAEPEDWILERQDSLSGTCVMMELDNNTSRTPKQVFDAFSTDDDYAFTKTVVPVRLAQYGDEMLVSRSQAKRLLVRVDRFKTVLFDFAAVEEIGQAFADEVFRVFAKQHPEITLTPINANRNVVQMINRAQNHD
jgi:anti-sigma regulatory factor (Ser/Thr protein kinase)